MSKHGRKKRDRCPAVRFDSVGPSFANDLMLEAYVPGKKDPVAGIHASRHGPHAVVESVWVHDKRYRRCGIGTKLYEQALEWACSRDLKLRSSNDRTEYSEGFWKKQQKKGRASCAHSSKTKRAAWHKDEQGRMLGTWPCTYYEMKKACPTDRSLKGRRRRKKGGGK